MNKVQTDMLISRRADEIKAAVEKFNSSHGTKIEIQGERRFPHGQQAIYSLDVTVNGREYAFCGCRTMPSMVVSGQPTEFVEFLDEFLETLS